MVSRLGQGVRTGNGCGKNLSELLMEFEWRTRPRTMHKLFTLISPTERMSGAPWTKWSAETEIREVMRGAQKIEASEELLGSHGGAMKLPLE